MIDLQLFGIQFESSLPLLATIPALLVFLFWNRRIRFNKRRALLLGLRSAALAALLAIIAGPFTMGVEQIMRETTSVLLIADRSGSMQLAAAGLDSQVYNALQDEIKASHLGELSEVTLRNLTTQDSTAIGDAIYQGIVSSSQENNVVVVVSDGNNNQGRDPLDVASFASEANTRIFTIHPDLSGQEVFIEEIKGGSTIPADSDYSGELVVDSVGGNARYRLKLTVDGTTLIDREVEQTTATRTFPFSHGFTQYGPHTILASITPSTHDHIAENNEFRKIVNVIEKPRILLVSKDGEPPLYQILGQFYDVIMQESPPSGSEAEGYGAILLDDVGFGDIGDPVVLRDYINGGGGLIVVGGQSSYDNGGYYESLFEPLLPVRSVDMPRKRGDQIGIVLLIDISASTGAELRGDTKIDVEKALAIQMINDLSGKGADIGIVAFNSEGHVVSTLRESVGKEEFMKDRVSRLQFAGGTYVFAGQQAARQMLNRFDGGKYIILISDGITNYPAQSFREAQAALALGVKTYTIGVGFDTDQAFMSGLARSGGGVYFSPDQSERVKLSLVGEEKEVEDMGIVLILQDETHFITEMLDVSNITITDFNRVTAKTGAQVLVTTQSLNPILTVWRFGLGRVAALTTDNGDEWAKSIYTTGGSRLITATVNWAVGGPKRDKETWIECSDVSLGDTATAVVTSTKSDPQVSLDGQELSLSRLSEDKFYVQFTPEDVGVSTLTAEGDSCTFAVNYPDEYSDFDVDTNMLTGIAQITGGESYRSNQVEALAEDAVGYTTERSAGEAFTKTGLQVPLILFVIALFLLDVVIRRLGEIMSGRATGHRARAEAETAPPEMAKHEHKSHRYNKEQ